MSSTFFSIVSFLRPSHLFGMAITRFRIFCQHVNTVILPALEINATITESTAQQWLRLKLRYECKEAKKGVYVDGHERPDVIKERGEYIAQIFNRFERYV
jgi:hypothetical protein